ncbi:transcriptional regulator [Clostridia bacterium]|nr:transcriptional regulator [Clostridia bacterium]
MAINITSKLLDAMLLSIVGKEDNYGYKITQEIGTALEVSESTLYPVLRRLQKDDYLEIYDKEYMGRNRRYYRITPLGKEALNEYRNEWVAYKGRVEAVLY